MWTLSDWVSGNIRYTVSDTVVRIDFEHAELGWGSPISGFYEFTLSEDGKSLTFHEKWTADNPEDATEYTEYDKTVVYVN